MSKRVETKLVEVPSPNKIPERDIDKSPILEVAHLGIDFGGLTAVDDFNMAIGRTENCRSDRPQRRGQDHRIQPADQGVSSPPGAPSCWTVRTPTA